MEGSLFHMHVAMVNIHTSWGFVLEKGIVRALELSPLRMFVRLPKLIACISFTRYLTKRESCEILAKISTQVELCCIIHVPVYHP